MIGSRATRSADAEDGVVGSRRLEERHRQLRPVRLLLPQERPQQLDVGVDLLVVHPGPRHVDARYVQGS
jgi:hypothetical protein